MAVKRKDDEEKIKTPSVMSDPYVSDFIKKQTGNTDNIVPITPKVATDVFNDPGINTARHKDSDGTITYNFQGIENASDAAVRDARRTLQNDPEALAHFNAQRAEIVRQKLTNEQIAKEADKQKDPDFVGKLLSGAANVGGKVLDAGHDLIFGKNFNTEQPEPEKEDELDVAGEQAEPPKEEPKEESKETEAQETETSEEETAEPENPEPEVEQEPEVVEPEPESVPEEPQYPTGSLNLTNDPAKAIQMIRSGNGEELDEATHKAVDELVASSPGIQSLYGISAGAAFEYSEDSSYGMALKEAAFSGDIASGSAAVLGSQIRERLDSIQNGFVPDDVRDEAMGTLMGIIVDAEDAGMTYAAYVAEHPERLAPVDEAIAYANEIAVMRQASIEQSARNEAAMKEAAMNSFREGNRDSATIAILGRDYDYVPYSAIRDDSIKLRRDNLTGDFDSYNRMFEYALGQNLKPGSAEFDSYMGMMFMAAEDVLATEYNMARMAGYESFNEYADSVGGISSEYIVGRAIKVLDDLGGNITQEDIDQMEKGAVFHGDLGGVLGGAASLGFGIDTGVVRAVEEKVDAIWATGLLGRVDNRKNAEDLRTAYFSLAGGNISLGYRMYEDNLRSAIANGDFPDEAISNSILEYLDSSADIFGLGFDNDDWHTVRSIGKSVQGAGDWLEEKAAEVLEDNGANRYLNITGQNVSSNLTNQFISTIITGLTGSPIVGFMTGYGSGEYMRQLQEDLPNGINMARANARGWLHATTTAIANMGTEEMFSGAVMKALGIDSSVSLGEQILGPVSSSRLMKAWNNAYLRGIASNWFGEVFHDEFYENLLWNVGNSAETALNARPSDFIGAAIAGVKGANVSGVVSDMLKGLGENTLATLPLSIIQGFSEARIEQQQAKSEATQAAYNKGRQVLNLMSKAAMTGSESDFKAALDAADEALKDPLVKDSFDSAIEAAKKAVETVAQMITNPEAAGMLESADAAKEQADSHQSALEASVAARDNALDQIQTLQERMNSGNADAVDELAAQQEAYPKAEQGVKEHTRELQQKKDEADKLYGTALDTAKRAADKKIYADKKKAAEQAQQGAQEIIQQNQISDADQAEQDFYDAIERGDDAAAEEASKRFENAQMSLGENLRSAADFVSTQARKATTTSAVNRADEAVSEAKQAMTNAPEKVTTQSDRKGLNNPELARYNEQLYKNWGIGIRTEPAGRMGNTQAWYDRNTHEIVISGEYTGQAMRKLVMHELTHAIEQQPWYKDYARTALSAIYGRDGEAAADGKVQLRYVDPSSGELSSMQEKVNYLIGKGYKESELAQELVAMATSEIYNGNEVYIRELMENGHAKLLTKAYRALTQFLGTVKRMVKGDKAELERYQKLIEAQKILRKNLRKTSKVSGGEGTSYSINSESDPDSFVQIQDYQTEQQKEIIREYHEAVDSKMLKAAEKYENDPNAKSERVPITEVSEREASRIKELTGADVTGYTHTADKNFFVHVKKRHGKNGQSDHTMANLKDVARVGWVLENYDSIEITKGKDGDPIRAGGYLDKNKDHMINVVYEKKLDGTIYVVEAAGESEWKKLWLVTAYIKENPAIKAQGSTVTQTLHAAEGQGPYVQDGSTSPVDYIVPQDDEKINDNRAFSIGDSAKNEVADIRAILDGEALNERSAYTADRIIALDKSIVEMHKDDTHPVISDTAMCEEAVNRVSEMGGGQKALDYLAGLPKNWSAKDVWLSNVLLAMYDKTGDVVKQNIVFELQVAASTEAGRTLRAYRTNNVLSASAAIREAVRDADHYNEQHLGKSAKTAETMTSLQDVVANTSNPNETSRDNPWNLPLTREQMALIRELGLTKTKLADQYNRATTKQRMLHAIIAYGAVAEETDDVGRERARTKLMQDLAKMKNGLAACTYADQEYIAQQAQEAIVQEEEQTNEPRSRAGRIALGRCYDAMNNMIPVGKLEKFRSIMYSNMLSAPVTVIKNYVANHAISPLEFGANTVAIGVDKVASVFTGNRTTSALPIGYRAESAKAHIKAAMETITDEFVYGTDTSHGRKYDIGGSSRVFQNNVFETYRRLTSTMMELGDNPFFASEYTQQLKRIQDAGMQKRVQTYNGDTATYGYTMEKMTQAEMEAEATRRALKRCFQEDRAVAQWVNDLSRRSPGLGIAFQTIVPFVRTPTNLAARMVSYSPLGIAKAVIVDGIYNAVRDGGSNFNQYDLAMGLGRGITGTALMMIGAELMRAGLLGYDSGYGDDDDDDYNDSQYRQADHDPYGAYITVGSDKVPLDFGGPAVSWLALGASVAKDLDNPGSMTDTFSAVMTDSAATAVNLVFENSMLSGVGDLFQNTKDGMSFFEGIGATVGANTMQQTLNPSWVRSLNNWMDHYKRDYRADNWVEEMFNKGVLRNTPLLSELLPKKIDVTGDAMLKDSKFAWGREDENALLNFLNTCLSPIMLATDKNDKAMDAVWDYAIRTGKTSNLPVKFVGSKNKLNMTKALCGAVGIPYTTSVQLNTAQAQEFNRVYLDVIWNGTNGQYKKLSGSGTYRSTGLRQLVDSGKWDRMSDEEREKTLKDVKALARELATAKILKYK